MDLKTYLAGFTNPSEEMARIAKVSGLSVTTLRPMARGATAGRLATAEKISAATNGKATVAALLGVKV